jgi:uncharacterized membrane protein YeaQ/YmgE (transglycosylase-associated protein family)
LGCAKAGCRASSSWSRTITRGAFVASYLGQAIGWYQANEGAGFIGAVVGAIILLIIYRMVAKRST